VQSTRPTGLSGNNGNVLDMHCGCEHRTSRAAATLERSHDPDGSNSSKGPGAMAQRGNSVLQAIKACVLENLDSSEQSPEPQLVLMSSSSPSSFPQFSSVSSQS
jgi:hypothetical protein